jgi:hypothetical protein
MLIAGAATVSMAQSDSVSHDPTFNCGYIDKDKFTCDLEDKESSRREKGKKDLDANNPVNGNQSNESNQNTTNKEQPIKHEVESDEGIFDNSCMLDPNEVNKDDAEIKSE